MRLRLHYESTKARTEGSQAGRGKEGGALPYHVTPLYHPSLIHTPVYISIHMYIYIYVYIYIYYVYMCVYHIIRANPHLVAIGRKIKGVVEATPVEHGGGFGFLRHLHQLLQAVCGDGLVVAQRFDDVRQRNVTCMKEGRREGGYQGRQEGRKICKARNKGRKE
jgi:hypothetical protein